MNDHGQSLSVEQDAPAVVEQPAAATSRGSAVWREIKGLLWVLLAVLAFHSFIAKPFYIPSESMMPALLKGDRLVVSKYPYGWSWVSPTIPNPVAIFRGLVLRQPEVSWGFQLPFMRGRVLGSLPKRGDVVILTPPGQNSDYIKRVIGLPGDTIAVRDGRLILNGKPVKSVVRPPVMVPVDANAPCDEGFMGFLGPLVRWRSYTAACRSSAKRFPAGRATTRSTSATSEGDDFGPVTVPAGHVFLMGDNRDRSADSRFALGAPDNGLGGPVPWENIGGRAEFITFSFDGSTQILNPLSWFSSLRSGRAGNSLRRDRGLIAMARTKPTTARRAARSRPNLATRCCATNCAVRRCGWASPGSSPGSSSSPSRLLLIIGGLVFAVVARRRRARCSAGCFRSAAAGG